MPSSLFCMSSGEGPFGLVQAACAIAGSLTQICRILACDIIVAESAGPPHNRTQQSQVCVHIARVGGQEESIPLSMLSVPTTKAIPGRFRTCTPSLLPAQHSCSLLLTTAKQWPMPSQHASWCTCMNGSRRMALMEGLALGSRCSMESISCRNPPL